MPRLTEFHFCGFGTNAGLPSLSVRTLLDEVSYPVMMLTREISYQFANGAGP